MSIFQELELMLNQGKITRREFIARVSALGLTTAVSPFLFTNSAHAATPKKGGRLRIGTAEGNTADSLDPEKLITLFEFLVTRQTRNSLVELDYNLNPIPELAESWESTPDATTWIFKLRQGIEFHNGKTLDVEDVIFSINLHRGEDTKSAAKAIVASIKEIKADGKHVVKFFLKDGNADFPYLMSAYHLQIVPNGTTDFDKGIGTGGYILQSFEPGVRSLVKRNPNYWKEGRAHFDEVETILIADVAARTAALKTGQVDVINRPDMKTAHLLEKTPGINLIKTTGKKHYTIPMLTDTQPFDNNDVRMAMKYAIDREQVLKIILRGYGIVGNDHPIAPSYRYYASELPQRNYDPDKAKYHLKKAGLSGHTFKLHTSKAPFEGAVDMAILFKEHAAKAGIKIDVMKEPEDGYWNEIWNKKPWSFCYWVGRPTEDWVFSMTYAADAAWNETHWKHERFNKLLKEARSELDESKRRDMYVEMQKIVRDEGGTIAPVFVSDLHAATDKLSHGKVSPFYEFDGLRISERWWFKS
jgi:peptide/nickel transport system substrate-binding protein